MNQTEKIEFRRRLGALVLTEQRTAQERGDEARDVIVPILDSLLSLAAFIAKNNASLSAQDFVLMAGLVARDQWGTP